MSHVAQPPPANTAALLRTLKEWSVRGSLRRLDSAFAGFMLDLCPEAPPPVVMAAALVAHMEGRGHSCLSIEGLLRDPDSLLGWDPEASAEFHAVATVFASAWRSGSPHFATVRWCGSTSRRRARRRRTPTGPWGCAARDST